MTPAVKLRLAARDPGAANVLAGLLRLWRPPSTMATDIWAMDKAAVRLVALGVPLVRIPEDAGSDVLAARWRADPADVLVTGTSHYAPFEPRLWRIAEACGIPHIALIDYWSNLSERFAHGRPQVVGALDPTQAEELRALGFAADRIVVTGHPGLAVLAGEPSPSPPPGRDVAAPVEVAFLSERIHDDVAEGRQPPWGFDEGDALRAVYDGATAAWQASGVASRVIVKFHPYETTDRLTRLAAAWPATPGVVIRFEAPDAPVAPVIAAADVVTGICSFALLEAILGGKPVISVQPNLSREMMYPPARLGYGPAITEPGEARRQVARLIASPDEREALLHRLAPLRTIMTAGSGALTDWLDRRTARRPGEENAP